MEMSLRTRRTKSLLIALAIVLIFSHFYSMSFSDNPLRNLIKKGNQNCDVYQGSWIYDDSYPLYNSSSCPYIRKEFNCQKYGRPDNLYLQLRWQPSNCDIPRFDGQDFLKRFKGKKIMFIGDSISLNQWDSLLCLLHSSLPDQSKVTKQTNSSYSTVTFEEYGVSLMLFTSHYLVDIEEETTGRILKLDSLKNGDLWKEMDVLVFNTWLWWYRKVKQPWDFVQDGDKILKDMDRMEAFRKGLTTWANWIDSSVDSKKTKVVFQGISPNHYNGREWGEPNVRNCGKETKPINGSRYPAALPRSWHVVKDVVGRIKKPVHLLDITTLSWLRKDGHPSSYNAFKGMDCTHWCIAGVQDTWNQLLYNALITN